MCLGPRCLNVVRVLHLASCNEIRSLTVVQHADAPHRPHDDLQEPGIAIVRVGRWKCAECNVYAWDCDDGRRTAVFNYNNHVLLEVSLLYSCHNAFMDGVPIQTFFATFLETLRMDCDWSEANPDLANR